MANLFRRLFGKAPSQPTDAPATPAEKPVEPAAEKPAETIAPLEPAHADAVHHGEAHRAPRSLLRSIKMAGVRVYALAVVFLVLFPAALAVNYLLHTVFIPSPVPKRFLEWQGHVDVSALREQNVPGVTGPAARAPLGHYHRIERWFSPDPLNSCTNKACHDPLPHTRKMKVPAFANFHATFLSCEMCHRPAATGKPLWIGIANNQRRETPALLRLMRYMEVSRDQITAAPREAHRAIVELLRQTQSANGQEASLGDLLLQIETSEPGSPVWRRAMERLEGDLPNHVRGEYGQKVAREASPGDYARRMEEMAGLASLFAATTDGTKRREIKDRIHGPAKEPLACVACHGDTPSAVSFEELGYSPRRAKLLSHLEVARLMQKIRQGEQFFIPDLLGGGNGK